MSEIKFPKPKKRVIEEEKSRVDKLMDVVGDSGVIGGMAGLSGGLLIYSGLQDSLDSIYPEYSTPVKVAALMVGSTVTGVVLGKVGGYIVSNLAKSAYNSAKGAYESGKQAYNSRFKQG
jgi:hypothetical protein